MLIIIILLITCIGISFTGGLYFFCILFVKNNAHLTVMPITQQGTQGINLKPKETEKGINFVLDITL